MVMLSIIRSSVKMAHPFRDARVYKLEFAAQNCLQLAV